MTSNLSKLNEAVEFDLSGFGEAPMLLGRVLDDPLHLLLGGGLLSLFALAAPGAGWILATGIAAATINDVKWSFSDEGDDDDFDGETVDAAVTPVDDNPVAQLKAQQPDSWVDAAVEQGFNVVPDSSPRQWPPVVELKPTTVGFKRASEVIASSTPADLLNLMGEDAPDWLRSAAIAQSLADKHMAAYSPEAPGVTGGDTLPVTPVTGKSDSLINGFCDGPVPGVGHPQSPQASDTAHDASVTTSDMSLNAYVNGLSLAEFKKHFCENGGELEVADLNTEPGRKNAAVYVKEFVDHYGITPVEFAVWWGWGLTKKGGNSPSAQKYRFVAQFVSDAIKEIQDERHNR